MLLGKGVTSAATVRFGGGVGWLLKLSCLLGVAIMGFETFMAQQAMQLHVALARWLSTH